MTETSESILDKNVDGGVETILLDLLARIKVLEARPANMKIERQVVYYTEGEPDTYERVVS